MTKISRKPIPEDKIGLYVDEFWRAITLLENKDEVRAFFRDLLTSTERKMLAKRLQIAKLLYQSADYAFIKKELNVSNETIANISRWLDSFGEGYRIIIPRLLDIEKKRFKNKLPGLWNQDPQAKLLVGLAALGAKKIGDKYKKYHKKRSAES